MHSSRANTVEMFLALHSLDCYKFVQIHKNNKAFFVEF